MPEPFTFGASGHPVDVNIAYGGLTASGKVVGSNLKNAGSSSQPIYFDAQGDPHVCDNLPSGGSDVTVEQTLQSGTQIASITVDGVNTKIYAPPTGQFVQKSGDVMNGQLEMASAALTSKTGRNITAGTAALVAGTSPLATGDIYIQYI